MVVTFSLEPYEPVAALISRVLQILPFSILFGDEIHQRRKQLPFGSTLITPSDFSCSNDEEGEKNCDIWQCADGERANLSKLLKEFGIPPILDGSHLPTFKGRLVG